MNQKLDMYRAQASNLVRNPDNQKALTKQYGIIADNLQNSKHTFWIAKRAYDLDPNDFNAMFNYGTALNRTGDFDRALQVYKRCAEIAPLRRRAEAYHHVGITYRAMGENRKACDWYQRAYDICGDPAILKDKALAMLALGKLNEGLQVFECRREIAKSKVAQGSWSFQTLGKLPDDALHWQGEDLTGKSITVYHEEGSGDFIQFCRFIPRLAAFNPAAVYLTGPNPDLLDLVSDNISVAGIVPLDSFKSDYTVGSMTLPWRVGVDMGDVNGKPYFKADPFPLPKRGNLNVGLVWRGNPKYGADIHRSMAFSEFSPLFEMPGVAFHSLQCGAPSMEVGWLGLDGFVANLEPLASSWRQTATLISALDAVVTVDTAVAHLAGALGKPVFILITAHSDWRWNRNSQKSVWYDSARVIRQKKQDDWAPCIAEVKRQLKDMALGRRQAA